MDKIEYNDAWKLVKRHSRYKAMGNIGSYVAAIFVGSQLDTPTNAAVVATLVLGIYKHNMNNVEIGDKQKFLLDHNKYMKEVYCKEVFYK